MSEGAPRRVTREGRRRREADPVFPRTSDPVTGHAVSQTWGNSFVRVVCWVPPDGCRLLSLPLRHIHLSLHFRPPCNLAAFRTPLQGHRCHSSEESTLSRSSEPTAGLPEQTRPTGRAAAPVHDRAPVPAPPHPAPADAPVRDHGSGPVDGDAVGRGADGLARFNAAPFAVAEAALLECCGSVRWAHRMASHRPYPDLDSLLAASDEAGYDLSPTDVAEALAGEAAPALHEDAPRAAHLALRAAHAAYVSRFGHAFVICLDGHRPSRQVDQVLAGIRARLSHDPDEERSLTAEEMRRLARGRIVELVTAPAPDARPHPHPGAPAPLSPGTPRAPHPRPGTAPGSGAPSPSVADRLPL